MNKNLVFDEFNNSIILHTNEAFIRMRKAGKLASEVLDMIKPHVKEGVRS